MLNVINTKKMYESWENTCQNQIEDYQTPEGEKTPALKVDWISRLPQVFSIQMNRLKFEDNNAVKVLSPMIIEKTIYADRFMIENRNQIEKIRNLVQNLREKVKLLETSLNEYQKFNGTDMNIQKVLELAALFFSEHGKKPNQSPAAHQDLNIFSPTDQATLKAENPATITSTISMLNSYASKMSHQITSMQA